jgi:3-dehydroquinate dehydratase-2
MIHVVNGPNLNLLGTREPEIYGTATLKELKRQLEDIAFCNSEEISFLQSNHEGEIIDYLQTCKPDDFVIINPGGLGHTSVCLRDCVHGIAAEAVEVHISNIYARESFRQRSLLSPVCSGTISGFGIDCYKMALNWYLERE